MTPTAVPTVRYVSQKKYPPLPGMTSSWPNFVALVRGTKNVQPQDFTHGGHQIHGLAAAIGIPRGELVLEVPPELVLSPALPSLQRFFKGLSVHEPDSTWRLVTFLAVERQLGTGSPWYHYIQHLPTLQEMKLTQPLWARQQLLSMFGPLPITHLVSKYQRMLKDDWHAWLRFMKHAKRAWPADADVPSHVHALREVAAKVTLPDVEWAFTVVLTRGFGTSHGTALAPVADDLNTDIPDNQNARWHMSPEGSLEVVATKPVVEGEEILAEYSRAPKDNEAFASTWGFALDGNERAASLSFEDCARLTAAVTRRPLRAAATLKDGECGAPDKERQPRIFCVLLTLAREHCPYVGELRP